MLYEIYTDSACDIPEKLIKEHGIHQVYFYVSFDDENYMKEKLDINTIDYYNKMIDEGAFPKTSTPNVQDYLDAFTPTVAEGKGIICICLSGKLSGSHQAARTAKNTLLETYPEARIEVIESRMCTVEQGLLVLEAVRMRDAGLSFDQALTEINRILPTGRIFFTVGNLEYLKRGGRIGNVAYYAASALGIKPLIVMIDGEIFSSGIARNKKKALKKLLVNAADYFKKAGEDPNTYSFGVGKGVDSVEADELALQMKATFELKEDVPIWQIGSTVGTHTGPYPLGFGFVKKHDL
ncbi:MAG TPA: DegV family protein [Candidatus Pelethocola excrementipullorum]|nr:DegV family protein [Candidatus Pelethocola excrementipullorum]